MHALLVLNDAPCGTERTYKGLRLGLALANAPDTQVTVFLMADAVGAAKQGQKTPGGDYNIERMVSDSQSRPVASCCAARAWTHAPSPSRTWWTALGAARWTNSRARR